MTGPAALLLGLVAGRCPRLGSWRGGGCDDADHESDGVKSPRSNGPETRDREGSDGCLSNLVGDGWVEKMSTHVSTSRRRKQRLRSTKFTEARVGAVQRLCVSNHIRAREQAIRAEKKNRERIFEHSKFRGPIPVSEARMTERVECEYNPSIDSHACQPRINPYTTKHTDSSLQWSRWGDHTGGAGPARPACSKRERRQPFCWPPASRGSRRRPR